MCIFAGGNIKMSMGKFELMGLPYAIDALEHAYYLDHQNRRPDHLVALWQIVNRKVVEGK